MNRAVSVACVLAAVLLSGCSDRPVATAEAAPLTTPPPAPEPIPVPSGPAFEADFADGLPPELLLYDSGWDPANGSAVTPGLAVVDGALQSTGTGPGLAAGYAQVDIGRVVTRIGAEFTFTADGDPVGAIALPVWTEPFEQTRPRVPDAPVHVIVSRVGWGYQVYDGGRMVSLIDGRFDPPLPADVLLTVEVRLSGDLASMLLPDGSTAVVADPRIARPARFATFESYVMDAGSMNRPRMLRVWAD